LQWLEYFQTSSKSVIDLKHVEGLGKDLLLAVIKE
jgi:hypothetical protein